MQECRSTYHVTAFRTRHGESGKGKKSKVRPHRTPNYPFFLFLYNENAKSLLSGEISGEFFQLTQNIERTWGPSWSPDGRQVVFQSRSTDQNNSGDIYLQSVNGVDEPIAILTGPTDDWRPTWSKDGEWIVYSNYDAQTDHASIYRISTDGKGEPELVVDDPLDAFFPSMSPDGHFVAYTSRRAERDEIFVASYPDGTEKNRVSKKWWKPAKVEGKQHILGRS